jgi:hypothetical protein
VPEVKNVEMIDTLDNETNLAASPAGKWAKMLSAPVNVNHFAPQTRGNFVATYV